MALVLFLHEKLGKDKQYSDRKTKYLKAQDLWTPIINLSYQKNDEFR